jgi:soluble lytic murein transglycosylase-like protein
MQLMPRTARLLDVDDIFDPEQNIRGGARHLRYLMKRFSNNLVLALAAYNAGEQPVLRHKGIPPYQETERYVRKVIKFYNSPLS